MKNLYTIFSFSSCDFNLSVYIVYKYTCVCMSTCMHMHVEARRHSQVLLLGHNSSCFLRGGLSLTRNFPSWLGWLASKSQGPIYLGFPGAGIPSTHLPGCFTWVLGMELSSSCLRCKQFIHWAVSPASIKSSSRWQCRWVSGPWWFGLHVLDACFPC